MKHEQTGLIKTLNTLASAYIEMGSYAEAVPPLEQALHLASAQPSPWLTVTLSNLGLAYRYMADYPAAINYTRAALATLSRPPEDSPDLRLTHSKILGNLGALYRLSRNFSEAESALKEALDLCRALPGVPPQDQGAALHSVALLYMDLQDYVSALPYLQQALELTQAGLGDTSLEYAVLLHAFAIWHRATGNLAMAVRLHEQVTAIYRQTYGQEHPNYATNLDSLAQLYREMHWHDKAAAALRSAVTTLQAKVGETHPSYLQSLNNLGITLAHLGQYAEAEGIVRRVVELNRQVFGAHSSHYATALHNLVMLLPHMSAKGLQHALAEFMMFDDEQPTVWTCVDTFFELTDQGYSALQLAFLEKIAAIERHAGHAQSSSYATTLVNLGQAYHSQGAMDRAEACFRQALAVEQKLGQHPRPELALRCNALADLCAATGQVGEALELMQEANRIETALIGQVCTTGSEQQRLRYFVALRSNFHAFLSCVVRYFPDTPAAVCAAFNLTLQRKALGSEALAAQRDALLEGKYPELASSLQEWRSVRTQIAYKTLAGPGSEGESYHRQLLSEWHARKEVLESALAQHIPEMSLAKQLQAASLRMVAGALPAATRLVEFVLYAEFDFSAAPSSHRWKRSCYLALVVSPTAPDTVTLVDLGAAQQIDRLIAEFRAAIVRAGTPRHLFAEVEAGMASAERTTAYGQKLRALVFDPLLPALEGATRIFLATDGDLTRLPFAALPLNQNEFLIDRYDLSYLNSGRDVLRFGQTRSGKVTQPLVMADPDFDFNAGDVTTANGPLSVEELSCDLLRADLHFARLQGTREEGEEVARLLGVSPLLDRAALEYRLTSTSSPWILHIATHGFFLPNQQWTPEPPASDAAMLPPDAFVHVRGSLFNQRIENPLLRSGLALAGANCTLTGGGLPPEAEDGILTAEDVTAMDLSRTELVVLSACETGLGDVMVGEGVYGLQRAMTLAGAKTLVMSLWKIPDSQTRDLMVDFYQRLLQGMRRAEALRQAQLALKERYHDPFYWAAFICQGDPAPLERSSTIPIVYSCDDGSTAKMVLSSTSQGPDSTLH